MRQLAWPLQRRFLVWLAVLLLSGAPFLGACSAQSGTGPSGQGTTGESLAASESLNPGEAGPEDIFTAYSQAWAGLDFAAMYQLLSAAAKSGISEADFCERYEKITVGIEAANIRTTLEDPGVYLEADGQSASIPFKVSMDTLAGSLEIADYEMNLVRETAGGQQTWAVNWSEQLIFPNMAPSDKVRARMIKPERGELRDRNGQELAVNGQLITIGVVPGKFDAVKTEAIPQMAAILGISEARITKALANATNPDWFYPVVTLPAAAKDLSAQLTAIDGVQYQKTAGRIYPSGIAAGLLIGYVGAVTAEDLANHPDEGYTANDVIGKMGLEQVYEKRLRGQAGGEICLVAADTGEVKQQIALKQPLNGENITLAIDAAVQECLYRQMAGYAGAAAAVNPQTGEILALVSTPSFDPNLLQTYVPDTVQTSWNEAVKSPFANRFKAGYAPGSVFKLVTAAIGLKAGTLDPAEALPISGLKWQPDASWGSYKVTRVKDIGKPVNLLNAFIYSDNIYFAQQALRAGQEAFSAGASAFGIGEDLPVDYPFNQSQIANQGLGSGVLQGEILLSPLHVALFYSALATNGDLLQPVLELQGQVSPRIWKAGAIAAGDVPVLTEALLQVVENPAGTGYKPAAKTKMLGKTGTAELKANQNDDQAEENGWFVAMNIDQPRLTIAMIIEDVKDRGASHYVVPLVKTAMDELFQGGLIK